MSIDITIEEMETLPAESYELFDIRGEIERAHGILPNSVASSADALMENPPEDKEKKIIICCSRGQISRDIAEELQDQGYEAYSLKGGYVGWLMADMKKKEADDVCEHVELSIRKKFKKKIWSKFTKAVREYELVKEGDRIAVGISGGKDSLTLLLALYELSKFYPKHFTLIAVTVDLGFLNLNLDEIRTLCADRNIPYTIVDTSIAQIVFEDRKEDNPCSLCAKMRKGALNDAIKAAGCNKIAYAHHEDDVVETMMLSLFYEGRLHTFSPVTHLDKTDLTVIRPLIYMRESEVIGFVHKYQIPVVKSPCPADGHTRREYVKELLGKLNRENPGVKDRIFTAIQKGNMEGWTDYFGSH